MRYLKFVLLCFCSIFFKSAFSQHITDSGNTWNVEECVMWFCGTPVYSIGGDTLIGSTVYKKVVTNIDSGYPTYDVPVGLREDTISKQVFFYRTGEYVAYDFNLNVGDTFTDYCNFQNIVLATDSITLLNGERRKRITFDGNGEQWIEGIGSRYGLPNPGIDHCVFDVSCQLLCFSTSVQMLYHDPNFATCFVNTTGVENQTLMNAVKVGPNPFSDKLNIFINENFGKRFEINLCTPDGKLVEHILSTNHELVLSKNANSRGIYFLSIENENGICYRSRIVIQ